MILGETKPALGDLGFLQFIGPLIGMIGGASTVSYTPVEQQPQNQPFGGSGIYLALGLGAVGLVALLALSRRSS